MDTITRNSTPAVALAGLVVVEAELDRPVEHTLHPQMNGTGWIVAFGPVRKRRGSLRLVFETSAAASAAVALLATAYSFTWDAADPVDDLTFVLRPGEIRTRRGVAGGRRTVVEIEVAEVAP